MSIKNARIVSDSACDLLSLLDVDFAVAPLKIITDEKQYVDDDSLDVRGMVKDLAAYNGRSSSSCPNARDWLSAFGDAENIFCVTLTGTLSGSFNMACTAKMIYAESFPDRNVFVLNSLSAGPEMALIVEKLAELIESKDDFKQVCDEITRYAHRTHLLFMLSSMKNFANNGRVSPVTAKMAGLLGIRVVGKASLEGELEPLSKCRGEQKALECIVEYLHRMGYNGKKIRIDHCFNENAAKQLSSLITSNFPAASIVINRCRGLCSFYAELGGLLVAFEK